MGQKRNNNCRSAADKERRQEAVSPQSSDVTTHFVRTPVHRTETEKDATIAFDVSGFTSDQLDIEVDEKHVLSVTGERKNKLLDKYVVRRRFQLQPSTYEEESISAELNDGVLELYLPKKVAAQPRRIPIATKSETGRPATTPSATDKKEESTSVPSAGCFKTYSTPVSGKVEDLIMPNELFFGLLVEEDDEEVETDDDAELTTSCYPQHDDDVDPKDVLEMPNELFFGLLAEDNQNPSQDDDDDDDDDDDCYYEQDELDGDGQYDEGKDHYYAREEEEDKEEVTIEFTSEFDESESEEDDVNVNVDTDDWEDVSHHA